MTENNSVFKFNVGVMMTENGLVPKVDLYDSAVDLGIREAEALENAMVDCVRDWLGCS